MRTKILISVLVLFSLLASCNMPAGMAPVTQPAQTGPGSADPNAMATAVELTAIARITQIAGSAVPATPVPTLTSAPSVPVSGPCSPLVTATVNANVRSGPDTAYDIVGSLTLGQTATIVGRNDAYTWWYIDYPSVAGNHAWIAGSVVASSCVPAVVQVVAAPLLPTAPPVAEAPDDDNNDDDDDDISIVQQIPDLNVPLQFLQPDLIVLSMQVTPNPAKEDEPVTVKVKVKNQGAAEAGSFTVHWSPGAAGGCDWTVSSLAKSAAKVLTCSYTYGHGNVSPFVISTVVDSGNTVNESDENNNTILGTLQVKFDFQLPQPWP
jgi:hypothetical protein